MLYNTTRDVNVLENLNNEQSFFRKLETKQNYTKNLFLAHLAHILWPYSIKYYFTEVYLAYNIEKYNFIIKIYILCLSQMELQAAEFYTIQHHFSHVGKDTDTW